MTNDQDFEPGAKEPNRLTGEELDFASERTGQGLRAMGWKEFDDLLNDLPGLNKGKHIQIMDNGLYR